MQVATTEAREHFSEYVNQVAYGNERVILTRHGQGIAAIISAHDLQILELIEDMYDMEEAKKSREEAKKFGAITLAELKASL